MTQEIKLYGFKNRDRETSNQFETFGALNQLSRSWEHYYQTQYKPQCIPQSHWNFRLIFYKNRLFSSKLYSNSASSTNTATVTKGNYGNQNWCVPRVCDLCIVFGQNQTPTYQLRCNWKKVIPCPSFYIYEWHKWHRWMGKVLITIINILFANSIWCNYIFSFFHVS